MAEATRPRPTPEVGLWIALAAAVMLAGVASPSGPP